jgi:hypothetical protein
MDEFHRRHLIGSLVAQIQQVTGRRYAIKLDLLDDESLREVQRLLRDVDHEKHQAVQQARLWPWRR